MKENLWHCLIKARRQKLAQTLVWLAVLGATPMLAAETSTTGVATVEQAGTITVKGHVADSAGEALIGVSVAVKGGSTGAITDLDGNYSLNVQKGKTLVFSYIGYKVQEIVVTGNVLNVTMKDDSQTLDEVVVVGFGTQKKVNLTGSVGVVDSKSLEARPITNLSQGLQGVVPGLQISFTSGELNQSGSMNVRGTGTIGDGSSGSPLVLIDGMEGDINAINPQDIENISVLKDAAASSIYGSRAPGGVILITTKKGKSGKPSINYNNNFRFNSPLNMPHMADSYSFALAINDQLTNGGQSPMYSEKKLQQILDYLHNICGLRMLDVGMHLMTQIVRMLCQPLILIGCMSCLVIVLLRSIQLV